jgi:hypothetical protein
VNSPTSSETLLAIGRRHWRAFLPVWLFPVAFFLSNFLPGWFSLVAFWFLFAAMLVCGWIAFGPWREGSVDLLETITLAIFVPFLIWIALLGAVFGLAHVLGAV